MKKKGDVTPPAAGAHTVQEGSVETIGGRPSGRDTESRSGEGEKPGKGAPRARRDDDDRSPDVFVSTEVNDKTSTPGRPARTRS